MVLINCGSDDNVVVNNNNDSSGNDNNNDTPSAFEPQNIEIEVALKCFFVASVEGVTTTYYSAMYTQEEFNDFIHQSMCYEDILIPSLFDNTFNFEEYQLLVAADYISIYEQTLDITSVTEYENKVIAVVENLESDFSYDLIAVPLIAVTIVKMPKIDKPVEFDTSLLWWSLNDDWL